MFYDISNIKFEDRWDFCKLSTLIIVDRESTKIKTKKTSTEQSFYVSNKSMSEIQTQDFFNAIRNHWQIESNNYIRDVSFREDKIRCFNHKRIKTISSMISVASNLLNNDKTPNIKAKLEDIACDPKIASPLFRKTKFL